MKIDHHRDTAFVVSSTEDVLGSIGTDLLETKLVFVNAHFDLVYHVIATSVFHLQDFFVLLANALSQFVFIGLALSVVLIISLIGTSPHHL
jgi:hypothetical protein